MKRPWYWVSVFLVLYQFFYYMNQHGDLWRISDWWQKGYGFYYFASVYDFGILHLVIPFSAVLPYSFTTAEDFNTKLIRFELYRKRKCEFAFKKTAAAFFVPFSAVMLGCLLFLMYDVIIFGNWYQLDLTGEMALHQWQEYAVGRSYEWFTTTWHGIPYLFELSFRTAATAGLWGLLGACVSTLWKRPVVTMIAVITLYFGLEYYFHYLIVVRQFESLEGWRPFTLFHTTILEQWPIWWRYAKNAAIIGGLGLLHMGLLRLQAEKI